MAMVSQIQYLKCVLRDRLSEYLIMKKSRYFSLIFSLLLLAAACGEDTPYEPSEPETPVNPADSIPAETVPVDTVPTDTLPETPKYEDYVKAGKLYITTQDGAPINSKVAYVNCSIDIEHENLAWCKTGMTGGIRGRGNSTWEWYNKKPYRIKFDSKEEMLGLKKAKSWVLLAEYRDPTKLMNAFVFELGQLMGLPCTNHNRWVNVTLNGKEIGLYHLTEQVQQNKNRVDIDELTGYLISLDRDDGPELAGNTADNFWSETYHMPVCIKNPEDAATHKDAIKADLGILEKAIKNSDYESVKTLLDVSTMIDYLIIQELVYNVELDAPRSMYMYKDQGTKWKMGPLWDFDAGFDFDWGNMYSGHNYFASYKELVLGTKPATHAGTSYRVPGFFSDLFKCSEFVEDYKARFKSISPLVEQAWVNTVRYYDANKSSWAADFDLWPISPKYSTQIEKMRKWIVNREAYLQTVVANY